jgi:hypothetical protein
VSTSGIVIRADHTAAVKAKMHAAGAAALKDAADELLQIATPDVPVSPLTGGGFTRDSGKAEVDEAGLSAQVSYVGPPGKPLLPVWVHEDTTVKHTTGRAKWLETAAKENAKRLGVSIGMSIKGKMR